MKTPSPRPGFGLLFNAIPHLPSTSRISILDTCCLTAPTLSGLEVTGILNHLGITFASVTHKLKQ